MNENFKIQNLILIGFMGSGKTSVGTLLSEFLNWSFIDLDKIIEKKTGLFINEIFSQFGEAYFRNLEKEEINNLKQVNQSVISLGGGAFCNQDSINLFKKIGITVYLKASYSTLITHYTKEEIEKRPLLKDIDNAKKLLLSREKFYSQADIHISIDHLSIEEIKNLIIGQLKEKF